MKFKVLIDGMEFESKFNPSSGLTTEKAAEEFAKNINRMAYLTIKLFSGDVLVLGQTQIARAVFVFVFEEPGSEVNEPS